MSAYITLEHVLKEILEVIKPRQEDRVSRSQVIDELRGVIGSVESLRGATVEPYGSFVSDLFTRWADLDVSIDLCKGAYISYVERNHKPNLLKDLQKALSEKGGWCEMQGIPRARVPILKCKSRSQSISCDVSVDNLQGQMKSKLLFWISEIDERFRDMVLLVKEWAKAHGINDSTSETFNSYSLSLLVIFHFQTCEPAILPPLEDIYTGNVADDLQGVRTVAERRIAKACADNISKFRKKKRLVNPSSLSKLFVSFLAEFSDIKSKASKQEICTYTGKWKDKRRSDIIYPIFIEDPFEQLENSARTVNKSGLRKISEAFESSHRSLISANQNEDQGISTKESLLAILVQERVSELIGSGDGERPNSSVFSVGFLLGGLVAGIGYMYAPKIVKAADDLIRSVRNDSEEDSDEPRN